MVGWHHRLNRHGFGWTPGVGDGQGVQSLSRVLLFETAAHQTSPSFTVSQSLLKLMSIELVHIGQSATKYLLLSSLYVKAKKDCKTL